MVSFANAATPTTKNSAAPPLNSGLTEKYMQTTGDSILNGLLAGKIASPKQPLLTEDERKKAVKTIEAHDRENKAYATFSRELIHGRQPSTVPNRETAHDQIQRAKDLQASRQKWLSALDKYVHSLTSNLESHHLIPREHKMYTEFIVTITNTLKPVYDVDEDKILASGLDLRKAVGILLHDYVKKLRLQNSHYKQKQMKIEEIQAAANLKVRGQYIQYVVQGVLDQRTEAYELLNANVVEIVASNEQHRKKDSIKGSYFKEPYTNAKDKKHKKHSAITLQKILKLYHEQQKDSKEVQKKRHNGLFKALLEGPEDEAKHKHVPASTRERRAAPNLFSETATSALGIHPQQNGIMDGWKIEWKSAPAKTAITEELTPLVNVTKTSTLEAVPTSPTSVPGIEETKTHTPSTTSVASQLSFGPGILPPLIPTSARASPTFSVPVPAPTYEELVTSTAIPTPVATGWSISWATATAISGVTPTTSVTLSNTASIENSLSDTDGLTATSSSVVTVTATNDATPTTSVVPSETAFGVPFPVALPTFEPTAFPAEPKEPDSRPPELAPGRLPKEPTTPEMQPHAQADADKQNEFKGIWKEWAEAEKLERQKEKEKEEQREKKDWFSRGFALRSTSSSRCWWLRSLQILAYCWSGVEQHFVPI